MLGANVLDKRDILMGNGKLYIGGVDVGQLKGDVSFTPTAEYKEFEAGVPKQVVKSTKTKAGGTLKAGIAELNPENVAKIVGSNHIHRQIDLYLFLLGLLQQILGGIEQVILDFGGTHLIPLAL